jgi:hypothetical protein
MTAYVADKRNIRAWVSAAFCLTGAFLFLAMAIVPPTSYHARYGLLCVSTVASFGGIPPMLSWVSSNLRGSAAPMLAVSLNVGIGNIGQLIGGQSLLSLLSCFRMILNYVFRFAAWAYQPKQAPGYSTGAFAIYFLHVCPTMFTSGVKQVTMSILACCSSRESASLLHDTCSSPGRNRRRTSATAWLKHRRALPSHRSPTRFLSKRRATASKTATWLSDALLRVPA